MRIAAFALLLALGGALLPLAAKLPDTLGPAQAGEDGGRVYVSGNADHLTFWQAGETPRTVTYTVGYADPRIGTGPHAPSEREPETGPPMLFWTGPRDGDVALPSPRDLVTVGAVRWDAHRQVIVSSGPEDVLTLWWLERGAIVRAKQLRRDIVPPYFHDEQRERDGRIEEEIYVTIPATSTVSEEVFERAPPGRIAGPRPDR